jgi:hypothetical protein
MQSIKSLLEKGKFINIVLFNRIIKVKVKETNEESIEVEIVADEFDESSYRLAGTYVIPLSSFILKMT